MPRILAGTSITSITAGQLPPGFNPSLNKDVQLAIYVLEYTILDGSPRDILVAANVASNQAYGILSKVVYRTIRRPWLA